MSRSNLRTPRSYARATNADECAKNIANQFLEIGVESHTYISYRNRLPLNNGKCAVLSYYRRTGFFDTKCTRDNGDLKRVMFSFDLEFADHLNYVINKVKKKLGFVIRSTNDFKEPNTILSLFKSLVVPILTYAAHI